MKEILIYKYPVWSKVSFVIFIITITLTVLGIRSCMYNEQLEKDNYLKLSTLEQLERNKNSCLLKCVSLKNTCISTPAANSVCLAWERGCTTHCETTWNAKIEAERNYIKPASSQN
jgi:hypothetical protein